MIGFHQKVLEPKMKEKPETEIRKKRRNIKMNAKFMKVRVNACVLLTVVLVSGSWSLWAQARRVIHVPGEPKNLPFSAGILVGKTLYVAGQQGNEADGKLRA